MPSKSNEMDPVFSTLTDLICAIYSNQIMKEMQEETV